MILPIIGENIFENNNDRQSSIDETSVSPVAYDIYGLSVYGRLGLFIIELVNRFGIDLFFYAKNKNQEPSSSNCHWILLELLLMYVLCSDNYRSRKSDYRLWDVSHVEESEYQGFKVFLEEVHAIIKNYTTYSLQSDGGSLLDIKSIITGLSNENSDNNSSSIYQIDNLSGLIEAAVKKANNKYSSYWARVLRILCSKVFECADIPPKCAEEFFGVIISELCPSNYLKFHL